jgi:hypothetical protein
MDSAQFQFNWSSNESYTRLRSGRLPLYGGSCEFLIILVVVILCPKNSL